MQTKILKNLKKPPHKVSNVMKKMNYMLYTVFMFQVVIILMFAGLNNKWVKESEKQLVMLGLDSDASKGESFVIQTFVFWVAYSHLIPISLYVIIEFLKLGQGYLINKDVQMYDKETESFANCRNSDLIEELGQVEIVFSDKTGTLTMNKMVFKKC
jgi:magnesium-transporting ATPase (P-type)